MIDDPQIRSFQFSSEDIILTPADIADSLGYIKSNIPQPVEAGIVQALDLVKEKANPVGGFVILNNYAISIGKNSIGIGNLTLQTEKIITRYFRATDSIAIMVCTIGSALEELSRSAIDNGDFLNGYIIDAAASELVEKTADLTEFKMTDFFKDTGIKLTNRYSPGYCGWEVKDQQILFSLLPENFCGIKINDSSLMIPVKSMSAIIGLGTNVRKEEYNCEICEIDFCYKRERLK